jgi:hypothetical protein
MADLKKYEEHFITLLEAGFIAVNYADEDSALKLFRAAELLNPKTTLPKVGLGYLHLHKLEVKQASDMFKAVLVKEPQNDMAKAFLGLCMSMTPDQVSEGEKLLQSTVKETSDDQVKGLATDAMKFIDEHVKKAPSPAEVQKPKNP